MNIPSTIKQSKSIIRKIEKLYNSTFDEDDIKYLLIDFRDLLNKSDIIQEFGNFVAHPFERDKGYFQEYLDFTYAKFKILEEFHSTGSRVLNFEKIERKKFESLFINGLQFISSNYIIDRKLKKKNFKKLLFGNWKLEGDEYVLRGKEEIQLVTEGMLNIISTINIKSIIQATTLANQFDATLKKVCDKISRSDLYSKLDSKTRDEITLCLISLLHHAKFTHFESDYSVIGIGGYYDYDQQKIDMYNKGRIALLAHCHGIKNKEEKKFIFPLLISNLKLKDYIDDDEEAVNHLGTWIQFFEYTEARRDKNNILKLMAG